MPASAKITYFQRHLGDSAKQRGHRHSSFDSGLWYSCSIVSTTRGILSSIPVLRFKITGWPMPFVVLVLVTVDVLYAMLDCGPNLTSNSSSLLIDLPPLTCSLSASAERDSGAFRRIACRTPRFQSHGDLTIMDR